MRLAKTSAELVEREIRIDAPPSVVFEFLTDPAKMVRWMGIEAVLEPWPGGQYAVNVSGRERVSGKVLEIIPERRLVVSWGWEDGSLPLSPGQSTVEITLQPDGEGTRLRLTHNGLPPDIRAFHRRGWDYALPRLAAVAAGRDQTPCARTYGASRWSPARCRPATCTGSPAGACDHHGGAAGSNDRRARRF